MGRRTAGPYFNGFETNTDGSFEPVGWRGSRQPAESVPSGSVGREDRARPRHLSIQELEASHLAVFGKEPLASSHGEGIDHEAELVDQVALDERPGELSAPSHQEVSVGLLLQPPYRFGHIVGEQPRVLPSERFRECPELRLPHSLSLCQLHPIGVASAGQSRRSRGGVAVAGRGMRGEL